MHISIVLLFHYFLQSFDPFLTKVKAHIDKEVAKNDFVALTIPKKERYEDDMCSMCECNPSSKEKRKPNKLVKKKDLSAIEDDFTDDMEQETSISKRSIKEDNNDEVEQENTFFKRP